MDPLALESREDRVDTITGILELKDVRVVVEPVVLVMSSFDNKQSSPGVPRRDSENKYKCS